MGARGSAVTDSAGGDVTARVAPGDEEDEMASSTRSWRPAPARGLIIAALAVASAACLGRSDVARTQAANPGPGAPAPGADPVARGKYLVEVLGCNDCHTPHAPDGRSDGAFLFAGHRAKDPSPQWDPSQLSKGVGMAVSPSGTAFAGPWGITYARNLTPDRTTGIGAWNDEAFMNVLREGMLKPPMPLAYGKLPDEDLRAILAYLKSIPAVKNLVPYHRLGEPEAGGAAGGKAGEKSGGK